MNRPKSGFTPCKSHLYTFLKTTFALEATDKAQSCAAIEALFIALKKLIATGGGEVVTHSDATLDTVAMNVARLRSACARKRGWH